MHKIRTQEKACCEGVIYSHESPKKDEITRDFDWELG